MRVANQQMKVYCIKYKWPFEIIFSVRILNMPAASLIAKVNEMSSLLSGGILDNLNAFFKSGKDEIFKTIVIQDFLFKYEGTKLF